MLRKGICILARKLAHEATCSRSLYTYSILAFSNRSACLASVADLIWRVMAFNLPWSTERRKFRLLVQSARLISCDDSQSRYG